MNFAVSLTPGFRRNIKRLAKKHRSLPDDVNQLVQTLHQSPNQGIGIGHGCYKIRLAVASKGGGKRGGARVITYVQVIGQTVYLLALYDKGEQSSLSDQQVLQLLGLLEA